MIPRMGKALGSLQHRVVSSIAGRQAKRQEYGIWKDLPPEIATEEAGFDEMGAYVLKSHNTATHYIATRLILDLCKETVHRHGA